MTAFRNFQRVHNNRVEIQLPQEFEDQEVEIIVLPRDTLPDDLSYLEEEIQKGMDSPLSDKSHEEIFAGLIQKYAR
jgi:hypothetical protein